MSINWVMLSPTGTTPFTPLPGEQVLYTSPPRIALAVSTPTHYPGRQQQAISISSSSGYIYLTTRRLIYLPSTSTKDLQSFAAPFLNLHDSHVTAPFFGPNIWQALLQPVPNGGIPTPSTGVVELKLTFKEGGAFDFHSKFERLKERAQQAHETESTRHPAQSGHVDLEDLPVYQEQSDRPLIPPVMPPPPIEHEQHPTTSAPLGSPRTDHPAEPPPQYEESQEIARTKGAALPT